MSILGHGGGEASSVAAVAREASARGRFVSDAASNNLKNSYLLPALERQQRLQRSSGTAQLHFQAAGPWKTTARQSSELFSLGERLSAVSILAAHGGRFATQFENPLAYVKTAMWVGFSRFLEGCRQPRH